VLHVAVGADAQRDADGAMVAFAEANGLATATAAVVRAEAPGQGIARYAAEHGVDLVVMGSHGRRGLERLFLGSTAEEVLRAAAGAVLVVRTNLDASAQLPVDSVLAPLDLSPASLRALPYARTFAAAYDARLDLLHVIEDIDLPAIYGEDIANPLFEQFPEIKERTRAEMERALAAAPGPEVPSSIHFEHGHADVAIVDFAEAHGSDLIVITRTGRRGLTRLLLGSAADGVLRTAPCPVLVVPVEDD
jgi:nucleotide-binding universal stress UspA family protein